MSFFGNKKKSPAPGGASYPKQTGGYPTQAPPPGAYPQQAPPAEAPPPYAAPGQHPPAPSYPPATGCPPAPGYSAMYQPAIAVGQFEAGARFNPGEQASVPPPPPGVAPTMVQLQAAEGGPVYVEQKKGDIFSGGGDGGINFELN